MDIQCGLTGMALSPLNSAWSICLRGPRFVHVTLNLVIQRGHYHIWTGVTVRASGLSPSCSPCPNYCTFKFSYCWLVRNASVHTFQNLQFSVQMDKVSWKKSAQCVQKLILTIFPRKLIQITDFSVKTNPKCYFYV